MLQKLRICDLSEIDKYNATFMRLYWLTGENSRELLRLYFSKLPPLWDEVMSNEYVEGKVDTIGLRQFC